MSNTGVGREPSGRRHSSGEPPGGILDEEFQIGMMPRVRTVALQDTAKGGRDCDRDMSGLGDRGRGPRGRRVGEGVGARGRGRGWISRRRHEATRGTYMSQTGDFVAGNRILQCCDELGEVPYEGREPRPPEHVIQECERK